MSKLSYEEKLEVMTGRINQHKTSLKVFKNDILSLRVFYRTQGQRKFFTINYYDDGIKEKVGVDVLRSLGKNLIDLNISQIFSSQTQFETIKLIKNKEVLEEINLLGVKGKFESSAQKRPFRMELKLGV